MYIPGLFYLELNRLGELECGRSAPSDWYLGLKVCYAPFICAQD